MTEPQPLTTPDGSHSPGFAQGLRPGTQGSPADKTPTRRALACWSAALALVLVCGCAGRDIQRQEARLAEVLEDVEAGRKPHPAGGEAKVSWYCHPETDREVLTAGDGVALEGCPLYLYRSRRTVFGRVYGREVKSWYLVVRSKKRERKIVWVSPAYSWDPRPNYRHYQFRRRKDGGAQLTMWVIPFRGGVQFFELAEEATAEGAEKAIEVVFDGDGNVVRVRRLPGLPAEDDMEPSDAAVRKLRGKAEGES